MTEGVVEKEMLEDVQSFLEPGVKMTGQNGSTWKDFLENHLPEAFQEEGVEALAGFAVGSLVTLGTGGAPLIAGGVGFLTAVVISACRKSMKNNVDEHMAHQPEAKLEG